MTNLHVASYPHCCGIYIISNFGHASTAMDKKKYDVSAIQKKLKDMVVRSHVGMNLVALNEEQVPIYDEMMKEIGFKKLVENFYHSGHGNHITLYAYLTHGESKPTPKPVHGPKSVFPLKKSIVADYTW